MAEQEKGRKKEEEETTVPDRKRTEGKTAKQGRGKKGGKITLTEGFYTYPHSIFFTLNNSMPIGRADHLCCLLLLQEGVGQT